jgi:hypothetical protein
VGAVAEPVVARESQVVCSHGDRFDSTLVGGSERLVERIVADRRLQAFPIKASDDLSYAGDTVNPPPP